jgi:hypothetical protein
MTRTQLDHSIAAKTGESLSVIRRLGFQLQTEPSEGPAPAEDTCLVVHCPFCRRAIAYPGRSGDGGATFAECDDCDVFFECRDRDVFPASSRSVKQSAPARKRYIPARPASRQPNRCRPRRSPITISSTRSFHS